MIARSLTHRWLVAVALAAPIATAACGGVLTPPTSPPPPIAHDPAAAVAQAEGVVVTVRVDRDELRADESIAIRIEVLNVGLDPVTWQSGGCGLLNGLSITGPAPRPDPPGKDWPGAAGLAKWSATTMVPSISFWRPADARPDVAVGCPDDLDYEDIDPGETITAEASWVAESTYGVPLLGGAYAVHVDFPFLGRGSVDDLGPVFPDVKPIRVRLPLAVAGAEVPAMPPTLAIDAAMADPRVAAWFDAEVTQDRLGGARIQLHGDAWVYEVDLLAPEETGIIMIDATTGEVTEVVL